MKTVHKSVLAAACLLLVAAPVHAQAPGIDLKLNPRIGLYAPLSDLGEIQTTGETIVVEQSGGLALGLGAELDLPMMPVNLRVNLDYATGAEISFTSGGVELTEPVETNLLAVVGDLVFRPLPRVAVVQPYLFAGGGLKQYDVGDDTTYESFKEDSDATLHLGGGIDLGIGPVALNAELSDYISWYAFENSDDSEMQHDLFVSIGFVIGLL